MNRFFWAKVAKSDGCWLWTGAKDRGGYGHVCVNGSTCKAHRVSYELANGPIPAGLYVCHRCDVRACVNPEHLFLGTSDDNMADMVCKGRHIEKTPRGERHGRAKLTAARAASARFLLALGATQRDCGAWFGVSEPAIGRLSRGETWPG